MEGFMSLSLSPEQEIFTKGFDASSPASLVEYGIQCIEQGHFAEGTAFLEQARRQLLPHQRQLTAALEAMNAAITSRLQAQQALQDASKRFTESDSEQQVRLDALKKLLPSPEEAIPVSSARAQARKDLKRRPSLRLLPPLLAADQPSATYQSLSSEECCALSSLHITCFGRFEVRRRDPSSHPITLCANLKGQAILRYLVAQPKHRETVDMLMAALWPEEDPKTAEHKLRIAISALRCSLNREIVSEPGGGYILCKDQVYHINPMAQLYCDTEEFLALYQAGQKAGDSQAAMLYYERACQLYSGPFLAEDIYAEWSYFRREELTKIYVTMCDRLTEYYMQSQGYDAVVKWASAILKVDRCDEAAHRQLMRANAAQGRRSEALRQYQQCQKVLREELGVQPMSETQKLIHTLLN
jgi:DNA-binding SARP family transcriptional activator